VRRIVISDDSESREERPAVLCAVCGEGIGSIADLAMSDAGPTHLGCRPASPAEAAA
jgi:hypothetical protein